MPPESTLFCYLMLCFLNLTAAMVTHCNPHIWPLQGQHRQAILGDLVSLCPGISALTVIFLLVVLAACRPNAPTPCDSMLTGVCMAALQNTMAHGVARLSPRFSRDKMRWLSLGQTEAGFWQRNLFNLQDPQHASLPGSAAPDHAHADRPQHNSRLAWYGVPEAACRELLNPGPLLMVDCSSCTLPGCTAPRMKAGSRICDAALTSLWQLWMLECGGGSQRVGLLPVLAAHPDQHVLWHAGFTDPFPVSTVTLDNPSWRIGGFPLMAGKLDWLLLRDLKVEGTEIGNHNYIASDHKWLAATVSFV